MASANGTLTVMATPLAGAQSATPPLDSLPPEILLELVSWLDWRSLQHLGRTSRRCRCAVSSHLGRLRAFRVSWENLGCVEYTVAELTVLLTQLTALRELCVESWGVRIYPQQLLEAIMAASWCWPLLERLDIELWEYPIDLLERFCAGCERLTDVTLDGEVDDRVVEAVLRARPGLLALDVSYGTAPRGEFLVQLPSTLRRLAVCCDYLPSSAAAKLARCSELRSLKLALQNVQRLRPEDLATGLAGCVRLERLALCVRKQSLSECLPPAGLPALRHLDLSFCRLADRDLQQLLRRLPNLQSVCLDRCTGLTQYGLALIGRLPTLSWLSLRRTEGVSDWVLERLSTAPLTELVLGDSSDAFFSSVTAEGLVRFSQACLTLRKMTLKYHDELVGSIQCRHGTDERRLLERLQACLYELGR